MQIVNRCAPWKSSIGAEIFVVAAGVETLRVRCLPLIPRRTDIGRSVLPFLIIVLFVPSLFFFSFSNVFFFPNSTPLSCLSLLLRFPLYSFSTYSSFTSCPILAYFPYFEKKKTKVVLWDDAALCLSSRFLVFSSHPYRMKGKWAISPSQNFFLSVSSIISSSVSSHPFSTLTFHSQCVVVAEEVFLVLTLSIVGSRPKGSNISALHLRRPSSCRFLFYRYAMHVVSEQRAVTSSPAAGKQLTSQRQL